MLLKFVNGFDCPHGGFDLCRCHAISWLTKAITAATPWSDYQALYDTIGACEVASILSNYHQDIAPKKINPIVLIR
jgi:hypothetical protein